MTDKMHQLYLWTLVSGCLQGMTLVTAELREPDLGNGLSIGEGDLLEAAVLLVATLIEADPTYHHSGRFEAAADMVRDMVQHRLQLVKFHSDKIGTKMLFKLHEAALGPPSDGDDRDQNRSFQHYHDQEKPRTLH